MTKRLAFFVDSMAGGGAERVMLNLANEYVNQGFDVDLVLARNEGEYLKDVGNNIRIIDLKAVRFWTYFFPLVRYFRSAKPDVMLSATTIINLIAILSRSISLTKNSTHLVISEHIDIMSIARSGALQRQDIVKRLIAFLYPKADKIVAVSSGAAQSLARFSGIAAEKITPIYNGVIDQDKLELAKQKLDHPWFGARQTEQPVIVAVGRLQAQKDYPTLLKAFALVIKQRKAKLIILGEGELRQQLEIQAKELEIANSVSFHGFEQNPYQFLAQANVFALSSEFEGLPTVLIEALACGCPVVSTNCPSGPQEILENGEYGKLVEVGDYNAFATALIETLEVDSTMLDAYKQKIADHGKKFSVEKAFVEYSKALGLSEQIQ